MASFNEYVRLIAEGNEAIAVINKINEAIAKMRREASQPINVKIKSDIEAQVAGERRIRAEKKKTVDQEEAAIQKLKAERSAIKRMNEEQGNAPHNIRLGSPQSIAQAQRFNEQLEESTKRINRLADAHKHIKQTAKAADVEVSHSLSEKLAAQTVGRTEKSDAQAIKDAAAAQAKAMKDAADKQKEFDRQMAQGLTRSAQIQKQADAAAVAAENERLRLSKRRFEEEMKAERIIGQMEKERIRAEEAEKRKQAQAVREIERAEHRARRERETQLASIREGGIRGFVGEIHRDVRRNMIYGGIGYAEHLAASAYEADKERDTASETIRQTGRSPEQRAIMEANAKKLSLQNPNVTATEMLYMQQHNAGAFTNFNDAMANNENSARYLSLRKGRVGEEKALEENLTFLKIGEETGRINNKGFMKRLYDQQLKIAQTEGAQYDPASLITSVRQLKSSKFGLSDDAMLKLLPFMGISEGASRIGNQIAMFSKSMTFADKQMKASGVNYQKAIAGTEFSNGKGGYNPELQSKFMQGDFEGVAGMVDKYLTQKGFHPEDKSTENINKEVQQLAKAIGNTSAREALIAIWHNADQIERQNRNTDSATGMSTPQTATRTLQGAQDAVVAQGKNAAAEAMKPFNPLMIKMMNGVAVLEQMVAKNPNSVLMASGGGLLVGGLALALDGIKNNPAQAANTAAIVANTGAVVANTTTRGVGLPGTDGKGGPGLISLATIGAGIIAAGYDVKLAIDDYKMYRDTQALKDANKSPEAMKAYNDNMLSDDEKAVKFAQTQADAFAERYKKQMDGITPPKGVANVEGDRIAAALAAALKKLEYDKAHLFHQKAGILDDAGNLQHADGGGITDKRAGRGYGMKSSSPTYHIQKYSGEQFGPEQDTAQHQFNRLFPKIDDSSAQAAIAKIAEAGGSAASALEAASGAVKEGAGGAANAITGAGSNIAEALNSVAAKISAVRVQGPATAGQAQTPAGTRERGNR